MALNEVFRGAHISARDHRLATELAYGAIKNGLVIDRLLGQAVDRPLEKLPGWIRNILRLGTYQLLFMERVPESAAVNESVDLAKKYGHRGTAGLVNAVLRRIARGEIKLMLPDPASHPEAYLSIKYSHPRWLIRRWLERFGFEATELICQWDNQPVTTWVRVNPLKSSLEEVEEKLLQTGIKVSQGVVPGALLPYLGSGTGEDGSNRNGGLAELVRQGLVTVQDQGAMLAGHVLAPHPGAVVFDICAGVGTKATQFAEIMGDQGRIIAIDLYWHKLELLQRDCHRLGIRSIESKAADARYLTSAELGTADYVFVDAPCSGLGVLRKRPDLRWRREEEDILRLADLQVEILFGCAQLVKPGGTLVYSTCTTEPEENWGVVQRFLGKRKDFVLVPIKGLDFLSGILNDADWENCKRGFIQLLPHKHDFDGYFFARLRRRN